MALAGWPAGAITRLFSSASPGTTAGMPELDVRGGRGLYR